MISIGFDIVSSHEVSSKSMC